MRGEMVGSRPMTVAERQRRSRSMRALRAEDEALAAAEADTAEIDTPSSFFTDAEIAAILAEGDVMAVLKEMRQEQRDALRRIGERLDDVNLRLRILADPFQGATIAGQRLRAQDEAEQKSSVAAAGARGTRRLP